MNNNCNLTKHHFEDSFETIDYLKNCFYRIIDLNVNELSKNTIQDYADVEDRISKSAKKILDYVSKCVCLKCLDDDFELVFALARLTDDVFVKYGTRHKKFEKTVPFLAPVITYQTILKKVVTERKDRIRIGLLESIYLKINNNHS